MNTTTQEIETVSETRRSNAAGKPWVEYSDALFVDGIDVRIAQLPDGRYVSRWYENKKPRMSVCGYGPIAVMYNHVARGGAR